MYNVSKSIPIFQPYEDDGLRIIGGKKAVEHSHPWIARIVRGCAKGLCLKDLIANFFFLDTLAALHFGPVSE